MKMLFFAVFSFINKNLPDLCENFTVKA